MKKGNSGTYRGFTLVELLVSILIGMIVILGLGSVMTGGYRSWNNGWKKVELQRDASYAMFVFSLPIKEATGAIVEESGSKLTIDNRDGTNTSFFRDTDTKELMRQKDNNAPQIVIKNVDDLNFSIDQNMVNITLKLKSNDLQIDLVSTIMMRNFSLE